MGENLLVGLIVALAAWYAATRYLPLRWREWLVFALAERGWPQAALARILNAVDACGSGCASCKACAAPETPSESTRRVIRLHRAE